MNTFYLNFKVKLRLIVRRQFLFELPHLNDNFENLNKKSLVFHQTDLPNWCSE